MAGDDAMVSKRSSRIYLDEMKYGEETIVLRSRRNSRQEDSSVSADITEEQQQQQNGKKSSSRDSSVVAREGIASFEMSVMQTGVLDERKGKGESTASATSAALKTTVERATTHQTVPSPLTADGVVATANRPLNFGIVVPGVYRSSYPRPHDFEFIRGLGLKTIVTLVRKDDDDVPYRSFMAANGIKHRVFDMKGTKKEDIPITTMKSILRLVLDQKHHPLLIHCNHGKHRTGCVVAVVRKVSGWDLGSIVDEYKSYAEPKVRECDVKYITGFELADVTNLWIKEANFNFRVRNFCRILMFTLAVLMIWVVSSTKIVCATTRGDTI